MLDISGLVGDTVGQTTGPPGHSRCPQEQFCTNTVASHWFKLEDINTPCALPLSVCLHDIRVNFIRCCKDGYKMSAEVCPHSSLEGCLFAAHQGSVGAGPVSADQGSPVIRSEDDEGVSLTRNNHTSTAPSHSSYQFLPWFAPNQVQYLAHTPVKLHHGISVGIVPGAPLVELPAGVGRAVGGVWSEVEEIRRAPVRSADELQRLL